MSEWVPTTGLACEYETRSTNQPVYCVQEKTHETHCLKPDLNLQQQSDKWGRICVHTNDAWPSLVAHLHLHSQRWSEMTGDYDYRWWSPAWEMSRLRLSTTLLVGRLAKTLSHTWQWQWQRQWQWQWWGYQEWEWSLVALLQIILCWI